MILRKKIPAACRVAVQLCLALAAGACADTAKAACTGSSDFSTNLQTRFIPADAPIGSIIGGANVVGGWQSSGPVQIYCSAGSPIAFDALTPIAPDITVGGLPLPAGKIMQTSIPGVGVAIWAGGGLTIDYGGQSPGWWPIQGTSLGIFTGNPNTRVTLIKTGPIAPGSHSLDDIIVNIVGEGVAFATFRIHGTVTVAGCSVPTAPGNNIPVPMGNVPQRAFQGPGSSAPAQDFNITLNSCIAGSYAPIPGGFVQGNFANIQLDAIRGSSVVDADRGILGLSPSANPDEDATGVAVQVLQNDGTTPMTLGMPVQLNRITNGTTLVPLKARYIQTGDGHAPTPGTANAYASFTVTYR